MDKWNRYDQNEYTGISAQRRNRRRADGEPAAPETAPRTPAFPDKPAAVKDTAFSASPETSAAEGSLDRIRRFMRPEAPSEPESFDEPEEEFEEQTVIEEPEVFELPDEREETAGPSEPVNPEGFSWLEEPDDPELPEEPAETEASEEPGENEEPEQEE